DAAEHHLLAPEQVSERAAGEHQGREREHVAVDDPLQRRDAGAQRGLHVGEGDAEDRVVEERQEKDGADRRQRAFLAQRPIQDTGGDALREAAGAALPTVALTPATTAWPTSAAATA